MSKKERLVLVCVLSVVFILVTIDVVGDSREGVEFWHLLSEGSIAMFTLFGIFYVLKDSFRNKKDLKETKQEFFAFRAEAENWRLESKKFLNGLSSAIDEQLSKWQLSNAEKEVAFLLLKGMSLKEIASIRNTTEKTVKVQSMAVYAKAGLSGRSELSAFFLEDLLLPQN